MPLDFETLVCYFRNLSVARTLQILACNTVLALSRQVNDSDHVDLRGLRIFLAAGDQGLSKELKLFKTHEPLATSMYLKELEKGMAIIDVGSNIGYYALLAAKQVGSGGKVLAIEPNPTALKCLKRNVGSNQLGNIELRQIAVWDKETTVWFEVSPSLNSSRVVDTNDVSKVKTRGKLIRVQATTLDSLLGNYDKVDWLRFDVEGGELQIINGATETIRNFMPNIFMEFHPILLGRERALGLLRKLHDYGYEIEYAVTRAVDRSFIAKEDRDLRKTKLDDLITELANPMPAYLLLLKRH